MRLSRTRSMSLRAKIFVELEPSTETKYKASAFAFSSFVAVGELSV